MSQGGSRRPYSHGGPRWHPRYKDYWDYEQNYSDGSSAGSPKEAYVAQSPPPAKRAPHHPAHLAAHHTHHHNLHAAHHTPHHDRRGAAGGAGGSRRAERRMTVSSERRRVELRTSPTAGAGPSTEHVHMHHTPHHHPMDTNPLEGPASGAGSSDGEMSSKAGDSPSRKRRRISRHISSGESNVSVAPPAVERRTTRHQYQQQRRVRYVSGGAGWHERVEANAHPSHPSHPTHTRTAAARPAHVHAPHAHAAHTHPAHAAHTHAPHAHPAHPAHPAHMQHAHHTPLLLDINQMSLRGARLGALGGGVAWPHRDHPQRTQVAGAADVWGALIPALPHAPLRYQMGGVYAGLQYHGSFAPPPRGPFASPPHPHPAHPHYLANSQRAEGRLEVLSGEGALSPLQPAPDLHHTQLVLASEPRGNPLELLGPHHTRTLSHHHHRRGGGGVGGVGVGVGGVGVGVVGQRGARPYVRAAPRWPPHPHHPHHPHAVHHIHAQPGGRGAAGAAARRAAAHLAAAAAYLPGVPEPAGDVPAVAVRGAARGRRRVAGDGELRGAAVPRRAPRGGQAARPGAPRDRPAAQLQVLPADAPGRADVVRGVHVRVRGAPDAARAALRARVPRQVRRQVAEDKPHVPDLPRERLRVLRERGVTRPPPGNCEPPCTNCFVPHKLFCSTQTVLFPCNVSFLFLLRNFCTAFHLLRKRQFGIIIDTRAHISKGLVHHLQVKC